MRRARGPRGAARGFTLIEVMVAMAIVAMVAAMIWGSFSQTTKLKREIEATQDRTSQVRMALSRIARELSMAYISDHEDPTIPDKRTFFDGRSHGPTDELTFSYTGHQRLYKDAAESDTALVQYFTAADPDDRRKINLMRRETRRLQALDPSQIPGETYVLCEDIVRFKLSYYDKQKKEWKDEWSTKSADGYQYLPWRIKITLTIRDERGVEIPYVTETQTMLTERIGWTPQ